MAALGFSRPFHASGFLYDGIGSVFGPPDRSAFSSRPKPFTLQGLACDLTALDLLGDTSRPEAMADDPQERRLVRVTDLLEAALDLASRSDAVSRLPRIASLCLQAARTAQGEDPPRPAPLGAPPTQ